MLLLISIKTQRMKPINIILALLIVGSVQAQNTDKFFNALSQTDLSPVKNMLSESVQLCIYEDQEFVSKSEAVQKVSAYLKSINPQSVNIIHKGTSKGKGSNYTVAKLKTSEGEIRVFVYFEEKSSNKTIKEIRFDKF